MCGSSLFPYTPTPLSDAIDLICRSSSNNLPQVGGRSCKEDRLVVAIKDLPWPMADPGETTSYSIYDKKLHTRTRSRARYRKLYILHKTNRENMGT